MNKHVTSFIIIVLGIALSFWAYYFNQDSHSWFYFGVMPGFPFVALGAMGIHFDLPKPALLGSLAAGLLVTLVTYGLLLYSSLTYDGGGANIGLGIWLLISPVAFVIAMFLGAMLGNGQLSGKENEDIV